MSPATARWVRLISRNARIAKVNVASSAIARRLPTSTIAMSSLPMVYQLYAPTSFAANRSTSNPLQRKTSSPLLARIRVMTFEPLRRHTGKEQRLYRPHSKYGADQSVFAPSACRGGYSRLQAGDATGAFKFAGERDIFTQCDFREAAHALEDFAADENRLISGRGAHQAGADADQRAKSTIGKCGVVELEVETPAGDSRISQRTLDVAGESRRHNRIGMNEDEGFAAGRRRADVHLTGAPA